MALEIKDRHEDETESDLLIHSHKLYYERSSLILKRGTYRQEETLLISTPHMDFCIRVEFFWRCCFFYRFPLSH